jgi:hypothetical protein
VVVVAHGAVDVSHAAASDEAQEAIGADATERLSGRPSAVSGPSRNAPASSCDAISDSTSSRNASSPPLCSARKTARRSVETRSASSNSSFARSHRSAGIKASPASESAPFAAEIPGARGGAC